MITARYRSDYDGEFIVLETRLVDGVKQETREWIPNAVTNSHISGRAAVILSRYDQKRFQHERLQRHRGGLLGTKRLQTYSWSDIWRDMRLDFYTSSDSQQLDTLVQVNYDRNTAVFTNSRYVIQWPGRFYPVPYTPYLSDPAMAVYLASFDQHKEVFLLGCNTEMLWPDKKAVADMTQVMQAYNGTQFISVATPASQYEQWLSLPNFSTMSLREFISYCDI